MAAGAASRDIEPPTLPTTDSCLSSCVEWQCGHSGVVEERTSASKAWWHWQQVYSKMGMGRVTRCPGLDSGASGAVASIGVDGGGWAVTVLRVVDDDLRLS
jgi:hypothetical protein